MLSVILGWPDRITTLIMGIAGGALHDDGRHQGGHLDGRAADDRDLPAALVAGAGHGASCCCPPNVSFIDAVSLAGAVGQAERGRSALRLERPLQRLERPDWRHVPGARLFRHAIRSQVQRYLTGKSIAQSRLSLLFNAMAKIPMQFFILFIGAMVFVFFMFEQPPLLFRPVADGADRSRAGIRRHRAGRYDRGFAQRGRQPHGAVDARHAIAGAEDGAAIANYRTAQKELDAARTQARQLVAQRAARRTFNDTNYIFLSFVTRYLPIGVVGLVIAVIFAAAMSAISGEINSLATVTRDRYLQAARAASEATDRHYLRASRVATAFWGVYAVMLRAVRRRIWVADRGGERARVAVLRLAAGRVRAGVLLPKRGRATERSGACWPAKRRSSRAYCFTRISFLWYNVIGCVVVIAVGVAVSGLERRTAAA